MSFARNGLWVVLGLALAPAGALAEDAQKVEKGLVESVASRLEISDEEAEKGSAAVLALAKSKLGDRELGALSKAFPEMDSLLAKADSLDISSLAGLTEHLEGLGIDGDTANGFAPAVVEYVEEHVGGKRAKLLKSALSRRSGS